MLFSDMRVADLCDRYLRKSCCRKAKNDEEGKETPQQRDFAEFLKSHE
jgi:hypothetical protein